MLTIPAPGAVRTIMEPAGKSMVPSLASTSSVTQL